MLFAQNRLPSGHMLAFDKIKGIEKVNMEIFPFNRLKSSAKGDEA
jgi:hypothetical protein